MIYRLDDIYELTLKNPDWEVVEKNSTTLVIRMSIGLANDQSMTVTFPLYGYDGSDQKKWVENKLKELEIK